MCPYCFFPFLENRTCLTQSHFQVFTYKINIHVKRRQMKQELIEKLLFGNKQKYKLQLQTKQ